jgi:hypothetical protein
MFPCLENASGADSMQEPEPKSTGVGCVDRTGN